MTRFGARVERREERTPAVRGAGLAIAIAGAIASAGTAEAVPDECAADMVVGTFVREGDPAPGTGDAFRSFDRPNINAAGSVAFGGDTDGQAGANEVLYVDQTLVAREGDAAPGTGGATFDAFAVFDGGQQINAGGAVAYIARVSLPAGGTALTVYRGDVLVAMEGALVPGLPGRHFVDFEFAGVADDGAVGFLTDLDGPTSDDSMVFFDGAPVYRQGGPVPPLSGETWDGNFGVVAWNGRGDALVQGNTSLPTSMDVVLLRRLRGEGNGPVESIVAQEGQPIDAAGGTDFLDVILGVALADDGGWALRGTLELAPPESDSVILTGFGFFAQSGEPLPEMPGAILGDFTGLDVNAAGDVLYLADLAGDTPAGVDEAIFFNGCMLLTDGTQVPGLPDGTLFSDIGFGDVFLNDAGEAVFGASYSGAESGDGLFRIVLPGGCPEDVNGTGEVEFSDVLAVLREWGECPPEQGCPADVDGDGFVEYADLLAILAAWGPC